MKTLITGNAGFLGSHIQDAVIERGHDVIGIDSMVGGYKRNINPNTKMYVQDLRDKQGVDDIFKLNTPEVLFHLAADASEGRSQFTPINSVENNFLSSINTFTSAIKYGVKRIIFTSSIAVYGNQEPPFTEDMEPKPYDIYAINKRATEEALKVLCEIHGVEYVIFRPYNIIGERQNMADPYRNVSAIFMNRILNGQPPLIYGDGQQQRAFSYVKNIVPVFIKAITDDVSGETFNIGPDRPITVNNLARLILDSMGSDLVPEYLDERPHDVKLAYCNTSKVKKRLGYYDRYTLEEGLENMVLWAKELGYQKPKYLDNLELTKNAPKAWLERKI